MKLSKEEGCVFNDLIDIELSPRVVDNLIYHFKAEALSATDYHEQGFYRGLVELFSGRYSAWKEARSEENQRSHSQ